VANTDWLREEFLAKARARDRGREAKWKKKAVVHYLQQVNAFLQRLLFLVPITGGQPARRTELLSLQWCNSIPGLLRNIFIENGLVSFVTCVSNVAKQVYNGSSDCIELLLSKFLNELGRV
jgi:hypothetical protein